jgi:hypothetical protein
MSPGGEWLGLLFCQWHFGAAARAGALPVAAGPVFFCPPHRHCLLAECRSGFRTLVARKDTDEIVTDADAAIARLPWSFEDAGLIFSSKRRNDGMARLQSACPFALSTENRTPEPR